MSLSPFLDNSWSKGYPWTRGPTTKLVGSNHFYLIRDVARRGWHGQEYHTQNHAYMQHNRYLAHIHSPYTTLCTNLIKSKGFPETLAATATDDAAAHLTDTFSRHSIDRAAIAAHSAARAADSSIGDRDTALTSALSAACAVRSTPLSQLLAHSTNLGS